MPETQKIAGSSAVVEQAAESSLLDQIVEQGRFGDPSARERGKGLIKEFVAQVLEGSMTIGRDADQMISARVAQIDHLISLQLNEVLHHAQFQKLESTWRGLKYLLDQSETGTQLKIRILNASKKDLLRDLQRAPEFDQSAMFKKVYEEEYGLFGGEPFGALVGDYEFSKHPEDLELLEKVSQVAASAHAPFLSAASSELLNMESFTNLDQPRDIGKIFDSTEYAKWKGFRESEDSKYVCLTCPRILMRLPYGRDTAPVEGFNFEEGVDGTDHSKYLWGNAAFALAVENDAGVRHLRLVRRDSRRGGRRPGGWASFPHFPHRRRRCGVEVPDRNRHHRPPRKRAGGSGTGIAGALQGHGQGCILQHPVLQQAQAVRQRLRPRRMREFRRSCLT